MSFQIKVKANTKELERYLLNVHQKQIPFATAVALNATAFDVRKELVNRTYPEAFHLKNTRFPSVVTNVQKATKTSLTARVGNVQGAAKDYLVQPTLTMAQAFSKERLANMIRDCPVLQGSVRDPRTRDSGNTTLHKTFPQGHITICGANSAAGLASRPIRIVLLDEVDRYPPSAGAEGDPVRLATKRTQTFWNAKKVMVSTPTIKDASRIEAAFFMSDQRHYYVSCPQCNFMQTLRWKQVVFDDHDPKTARYRCESCGSLWNDADRWKAVQKGEWRAHAKSHGVVGFHLNELYSSWSTLEKMVGNFLEAKKLPETLKTFVNTSLGETWEEEGDGLEDIPFMDRREKYDVKSIPKGALVVVAGVDVQDNRLEVETVGFGLDEECWSLEYQILYGDPSTKDLWNRLDEFLYKKYRREDGLELPIVTAAIDSGGHYTQAVYSFCRVRLKRRIYAVKGTGGFGKPLWPKRASMKNIGRVPLFHIAVDVAKDIIYRRLRILHPGPGYCHFPMHDEEYFEQLTSEKIFITYRKGVPVREFRAIRSRNEALDCRVYAYAAFVGLQADMKKISNSQGKKLEAFVEEKIPLQSYVEESFGSEEKSDNKGLIRKQAYQRPVKHNFMNSWRL